MNSYIGTARRFAIRQHGNQKYGDKPYEAHLQAAVNVLLDTLPLHDLTDVVIAAMWLHDTVECTPTKWIDIDEGWGDCVAAIVLAVYGEGQSRAERVADMYAKIANLSFRLRRMAATVKVADRITNIEASEPGSPHRKMYQAEREGFYAAVARFAPEALQQRLTAAYDQGI